MMWEHVKNFVSKFPLFRVIVAALPLIGFLVSRKIQSVPLLWPPLGGIEVYAVGPAVAVVAAFGKLPSLFRTKGTAKSAAFAGALLALVSLFAYGAFLSKYVVSVETPNNGIQYRTIGSQRTAEALRMFPGYSDARILEIAGLNDADIERMWTPSSVRRARIELLVSYMLCLTFINFAAGSQVRAS